MLEVIDKGREYPIEKVVLLDGLKQIVLRPTQNINSKIQLPVEFLSNPNIKEIKELIERGKFALKERIYFYWLFANEGLLRKYASQFYSLNRKELNEYGAYIEKRLIIAVFNGIAYQGEQILRLEIAYPPKLKEISIMDRRSYEVIFKATFQTDKGEFKVKGGISRVGDIYWENIPYPYSEILSQEVQSSSYIEQLIKPFEEVSNEGEGQNY